MLKTILKKYLLQKKKIIPMVLLAFLGSIVVFTVIQYFVQRNRPIDDNMLAVNVYFLNTAANALEAEVHHVELGEHIDMINAILDIFYTYPRSGNLVRTLPYDMGLAPQFRILNDLSLLEVFFTREYLRMDPQQELFFRSALVWTVTELNFIDDVRIFVGLNELQRPNGRLVGLLNRSNVRINPLLIPHRDEYVWLYFRRSDGRGLGRERRLVQVIPDQDIEHTVLEQLIIGPGPHMTYLTPSIAPDTIIRSVTIEEGICYVNLSSEFLNPLAESEELMLLAVFSVVNSLTDLSNVTYVQFLIDTEFIYTNIGGVNLENPIEADFEIISW